MELKQIKELMAAMSRTGTKRLKIHKDDFELELEREESGPYRPMTHIELSEENPHKNEAAFMRANQALSKASESATLNPNAVQEKHEDNAIYITSPMVGTFYGTPSPEDPAFVKAGDKIEKNTIVCIIEAMKVMNEVKAGVAGTIIEQLVESGHPVEFGTKLFKVSS